MLPKVGKPSLLSIALLLAVLGLLGSTVAVESRLKGRPQVLVELVLGY